jgi:hypothetical protein
MRIFSPDATRDLVLARAATDCHNGWVEAVLRANDVRIDQTMVQTLTRVSGMRAWLGMTTVCSRMGRHGACPPKIPGN